MPVLLVSHPRFLDHATGAGHPERPSRLTAVAAGVEAAGLGSDLVPITPRPAAEALVRATHPGTYLDELGRLVAAGGGHVDADTVAGPASLDAALLAAGAGLDAVAALDRHEATAAFCAVRPPGHHATPVRPMGFCLLNNVAVTARMLADRGERVLIVDIDAHHGNGTQDVFYGDPRVLYVSTHQYPMYPGTGGADEVGSAAGRGTTLNIPLPAGTTGEVFLDAFDRILSPTVAAFAPTWLLVSLGFDAHRADPLTHLGLTTGDYARLAQELLALVPPSRSVWFLEGGYDLDALRAGTTATLRVLAGAPGEALEAPSSGGPDARVVDRILVLREELGAA